MRFDIPNQNEFSNLSRGTYLMEVTPGSWRPTKAFYNLDRIEVAEGVNLEDMESFVVKAKALMVSERGTLVEVEPNDVRWLRFSASPIEGVLSVLSIENFMKKVARLGNILQVNLEGLTSSKEICEAFNASEVKSLFVQGAGSWRGTFPVSNVYPRKVEIGDIEVGYDC